MVAPKLSRRPPSGRAQCCCTAAAGRGGLLPASREVAQLRSLLHSKLQAKEAAFEVLRGLGTPVKMEYGKRFAVVSVERQPTLFEVLRSLDFKADTGTTGKGATMTIEDTGCNQRDADLHREIHREVVSSEGLQRPAARPRPASAPQRRASSRAPSPVSESGQAPQPASGFGPWRRQQSSARPASARSESVGRTDSRADCTKPTRPLSARQASTRREFNDPVKASAKDAHISESNRHSRPSSARPAAKQVGFAERTKRPASARQEHVQKGMFDPDVAGGCLNRPLSCGRSIPSHCVPHSCGAAPTLMDVLGFGQNPSRPNFAPPRPTSARSASEQRVASARLAAPRPSSAREAQHPGEGVNKSEIDKSQGSARRRAAMLAEARYEDSVRRRAGMQPESWEDNAARRWPNMQAESQQLNVASDSCNCVSAEGSQSRLVENQEDDEATEEYIPGAWHHSLQDATVLEDELKALKARVDKRVESARRSPDCEDASPPRQRVTPLEARVAAARSRLSVRAENTSPSCGRGIAGGFLNNYSEVPDMHASRSLQAAFARIKAGKQAFPSQKDPTSQAAEDKNTLDDLTLVPHEVGVEMSIQPPELIETLRARSQVSCNGDLEPTQSLNYSRSYLPDSPADNSVLDALESKGIHTPREDGDHNCTMLVLERALHGGA